MEVTFQAASKTSRHRQSKGRDEIEPTRKIKGGRPTYFVGPKVTIPLVTVGLKTDEIAVEEASVGRCRAIGRRRDTDSHKLGQGWMSVWEKRYECVGLGVGGSRGPKNVSVPKK